MSAPQRTVPSDTANPVHVLARACAVLDAVTARQGECRLADLGRELGLAKTTLHRLVTSLEAENMLRFDPQGRLWLGARLIGMAKAANDSLVERVRPLLEQLAAHTEETVDLSVLEGSHAVFVDQIPSVHRLRAVSSVGVVFPLHCTANGKAMLALFDDDAAVALASPLLGMTPNTLTSSAALRRQLREIRSTGVAADREEHTLGISALGVAVRAASGQVVAISVPAPTERFDAAAERTTTALLGALDELSAIVGATTIVPDHR